MSSAQGEKVLDFDSGGAPAARHRSAQAETQAGVFGFSIHVRGTEKTAVWLDDACMRFVSCSRARYTGFQGFHDLRSVLTRSITTCTDILPHFVRAAPWDRQQALSFEGILRNRPIDAKHFVSDLVTGCFVVSEEFMRL